MPSKTPDELLYDSEAALRLVDSALSEIDDRSDGERGAMNRRSALDLVAAAEILKRGQRDIAGVLESLRHSRALLERATLDKISRTGDKLREVSDVTEHAATDILNGIERATTIVDELDACDEVGNRDRAQELRVTLRDELFALMGHMQFQDITSQQLAYASAVIDDIEVRLAAVAQLFDHSPQETDVLPASSVLGAAAPASFDPEATTAGRVERQAMADEIIAASRHRD
jgi:chemotaxis regulatin CheY-phosphate phosphatase CheZ